MIVFADRSIGHRNPLSVLAQVNQWHDLGIETVKLTDPIANPQANQQWELRYPAVNFPDGGITEMFFFTDHECTVNIPAPEARILTRGYQLKERLLRR